jgi:hypothetical protein
MKGKLSAAVAGLVCALTLGVAPALAGGNDSPVGPVQSLTQSQTATNSVSQDAQADATSLNLAPNVAVLNDGNTTQSSGASANAGATNSNRSTQVNDQSQDARQGDTHPGCGCSSDGSDNHPSSVKQSQDAQNTIDQTAKAHATSVNVAPNVAIGNRGDTTQSSGSSATANASNWNNSAQGNWQSQNAGSQGDGRGSKLDQSQTASNAVTQSADSSSTAKNWSPNVAFGNQGDTTQSSGSTANANAANGNRSTQGNEQSQVAGWCKQEARCGPPQCREERRCCEPCCS